MYAGINLRIAGDRSCSYDIDCLLKKYGVNFDEQNYKKDNDNAIQEDIRKYVQGSANDCRLDGDAMEEEWFPNVESSIFLSHSHEDEILALKIKKLLEEKFHQRVFVDSYVWRYCNDLLKLMDDKYSLEGNYYNYQKRNNTTAVVHMMLASALTKMMDKSECAIFLNTNKSNLNSAYGSEIQTASPWIYHELLMMNLLEKKLSRERKQKLFEASESFGVERRIKVDLPLFNFVEFKLWLSKAENLETQADVLDVLYRDIA